MKPNPKATTGSVFGVDVNQRLIREVVPRMNYQHIILNRVLGI